LGALSGSNVIADVTLQATVHSVVGATDGTGTAVLKASSTKDSRIDITLPSGNRSEIRNHSAAPLADSFSPMVPAAVVQAQMNVVQPIGAWSGSDGVLHGMRSQSVSTDATWFFPPMTVATFTSSHGYTVSYVGVESKEGVSVIHLRATNRIAVPSAPVAVVDWSQMELFLDSTTFLPVALDFNSYSDSNALIAIPTEIRFSNYAATDGIQIPFRVQKYVHDSLVLDFTIQSVTLNSGLAASVFSLN
jgi:hypothetical protein